MGSNNIYIGDTGVAGGESNVIAIGRFPASGTEYVSTYVGGIVGAEIQTAYATPVYIDVNTGQLATVLVGANGRKTTIPARRRAQHQAMLNQSEHRKIGKLQVTIAALKATVARQEKETQALAAQVKEQAAQIQKVSAQLETSQPATTVVANKP
jgi:hypothetical protein